MGDFYTLSKYWELSSLHLQSELTEDTGPPCLSPSLHLFVSPSASLSAPFPQQSRFLVGAALNPGQQNRGARGQIGKSTTSPATLNTSIRAFFPNLPATHYFSKSSKTALSILSRFYSCIQQKKRREVGVAYFILSYQLFSVYTPALKIPIVLPREHTGHNKYPLQTT